MQFHTFSNRFKTHQISMHRWRETRISYPLQYPGLKPWAIDVKPRWGLNETIRKHLAAP